VNAQVFPLDGGDLVGKVLVLVAAGLILWWALRPRFQIRITVDGGQLLHADGMTAWQRGKLADFFDKDAPLERRLTIVGLRGRDGRLWLKFRGRVDRATEQRIRNFLTLIL